MAFPFSPLKKVIVSKGTVKALLMSNRKANNLVHHYPSPEESSHNYQMSSVGGDLTGINFPPCFLLEHVPLDHISKYHLQQKQHSAHLWQKKTETTIEHSLPSLEIYPNISTYHLQPRKIKYNHLQHPPTANMTQTHAFLITSLTENVYSVEKLNFPKVSNKI